jgi:hypothetical protein
LRPVGVSAAGVVVQVAAAGFHGGTRVCAGRDLGAPVHKAFLPIEQGLLVEFEDEGAPKIFPHFVLLPLFQPEIAVILARPSILLE